jgi:uncharacterized membrane protein (UPF0182 family)
MRLAAATSEAEPNIMLTSYFTANSRMMIHRKVRDRVQQLAPFLSWDTDPYLVITDAGRLVWIIDGYTTSDAHPYSRAVDVGDMGGVNYIRNAVKATIDGRPDHRRLQQSFPRSVPAGRPHAGRSAAARALSGDALQRAGGDLPDVPHARSEVVL